MAASSMDLRRVTVLADTRPSSTSSSTGALPSRRYNTAYPSTMVRGLMDLADRITEVEFTGSQFMAYEKPSGETGTLGEMNEDMEALHLMADLPGLSNEDVTVFIIQDQLHVMAQEGNIKEMMERLKKKHNNKEEEEEEETTAEADDEKLPTSTRYLGGLALKPKSYKVDGVTAEMNNGQLHIIVPKLKIEEREDLINIPDVD